MLDRPTCEALAAALPEVREHKPEAGDWFWIDRPGMRPGILPTITGWYDRVVWDVAGTDTGEGQEVQAGDLWCPALSDLLAMVVERDATVALVHHFAPKPPGIVMVWTCAGDLGRARGQDGDTPEAAVAAWLLAAEKGR